MTIEEDFIEFVRKPFVIEAIEITKENIAELAPYIGELKFRDDDPGSPYIQVNKRLVPNVFRVFPGYYMTRLEDNIRCYSRKVFREQFAELTASIGQWVAYMNGEKGLVASTPIVTKNG